MKERGNLISEQKCLNFFKLAEAIYCGERRPLFFFKQSCCFFWGRLSVTFGVLKSDRYFRLLCPNQSEVDAIDNADRFEQTFVPYYIPVI